MDEHGKFLAIDLYDRCKLSCGLGMPRCQIQIYIVNAVSSLDLVGTKVSARHAVNFLSVSYYMKGSNLKPQSVMKLVSTQYSTQVTAWIFSRYPHHQQKCIVSSETRFEPVTYGLEGKTIPHHKGSYPKVRKNHMLQS